MSQVDKLHLGDCLEGLPALGDKSVDHTIADPPYSPHVHNCARRGDMGYAGDTGRAAISRTRELGFDPLAKEDRRALAVQYARVTRRWVLVFSDTESAHLWREDLEAAGLGYVRTLFWHKIGSTPQFTGDRPAVAVEAITLCHPPVRKKWNGGGKHGLYPFPIVLNRDGNSERLHPTQKPIELMRALVQDFTDPGELILDSHAGSGTTAVAALELGRRFIGWERDPKHHAAALERIANIQRQEQLFRPVAQQLSLGAGR